MRFAPYPQTTSPATANGDGFDGVSAFRSGLFLHRIRTALRLNVVPCTTERNVTKETLSTIYLVEKIIVRDFISTLRKFGVCGFLDEKWRTEDVAEYFYPFWNLFEHLQSTARQNGHLKNVSYFIDGTMCVLTPNGVEDYWRTVPEVPDTVTVARRFLDLHVNCLLPVAKMIRQLDFDDFETTIVSLLLFAYYGKPLFVSRQEHTQFLETLWKHLRHHYEDDVSNFAERLDAIMRFLGEFNRAFHAKSQAYTMADVMSPNTESYECLRSYRVWREVSARVESVQ